MSPAMKNITNNERKDFEKRSSVFLLINTALDAKPRTHIDWVNSE